ncbi:hypothetical protein OIU78_009896 [Salix suchowensis]|nr:hypothetical protein OIU78_009896 [Salix suchowensis]
MCKVSHTLRELEVLLVVEKVNLIEEKSLQAAVLAWVNRIHQECRLRSKNFCSHLSPPNTQVFNSLVDRWCLILWFDRAQNLANIGPPSDFWTEA